MDSDWLTEEDVKTLRQHMENSKESGESASIDAIFAETNRVKQEVGEFPSANQIRAHASFCVNVIYNHFNGMGEFETAYTEWTRTTGESDRMK